MRFLKLRNLLMDAMGWDRRVATLAARLYLGADTPESIKAMSYGDYGRSILSEGEYREICLNW